MRKKINGYSEIEMKIRNDPAYHIEKSKIFEKCREKKNVKPLIQYLEKLISMGAKITVQVLAKDYLKYLKNTMVQKRCWRKKTIKKFTYAIIQVQQFLNDNDLNECAKWIKKEWDKWVQKELWEKIGYKGSINTKMENDPIDPVEKELMVLKRIGE